MSPVPSLFCFGLGYTATRLAQRLLADGWRVGGTARDDAQRSALCALGIEARPFEGLSVEALAGYRHLLTSVPPASEGDPVLHRYRATIRELPDLRWVGYLSTTGVYGDAQGAWVDEDHPVAPNTERSRRRVTAEAVWLELGPPVHVFRLSGIYGPGRSTLDSVRAGHARRLVKPGHVFNRCHVDDLVSVLVASLERPRPGAIYNVADETPAPMADVVTCACELLGVEPPPVQRIDEADCTPAMASYFLSNRRIRSARIQHELGVRLQYPDYRAGLEAIARG